MLNSASNNIATPPVLNSDAAPQPVDASYTLALAAVEAADDRKAGDIAWLHVEGVSILSDYFIIVTGYSITQVRAIATAIEDSIEERFQRLPRQIEGRQTGTWILMDYEDTIVHIMLESEREFYNLEAFWGHAPRIPFPPSSDSESHHANAPSTPNNLC
ncbi:MAG: ribosome silencing factor [Cyanobacteria bacterium J06642_2]